MGRRVWQTVALTRSGQPLRSGDAHSREQAVAVAAALRPGLAPAGEASLQEALTRTDAMSGGLAVGVYPGATVVLGFDIAYALVCPTKDADRIVAALGAPEIAATLMQGVSGSWGYGLYREGRAVRRSMGVEGEWMEHHGEPLPAFEPELVGARIERDGDGRFVLAGDPDGASGYDFGDEAAARIADHYLPPALLAGLRCTVFARRGLLSRLFGR